MRLKAKRPSEGSGRGSRLRLTLLLATAAALLLVPVAGAQAAPGNLTVEINGTGEGEVGGGDYFGFFPTSFSCAYASPGPETGTCVEEMTYESGAGFTGGYIEMIPGSESELANVEVVEGEAAVEPCTNSSSYCMIGHSGESTEDAKVVITFNAAASEQPLTLKINEGEGTVVSNPAGITCTGSSGKECTSEFEEGAEVTLTASPAAGYRFQQWQNCPSGNFGNRQCTVTMSEAKEVSVKFKRVYALTIVKAGSGLGSIYNNKNGLTCTLRCQTVTIPFPEGVSFTLTGEAPNKEFYFKEFTGGTGSASACSGTECTMTLSEASTVEAVFEDRPTETLSIDKEGGGTAKIWGLLWCSENCTSTSGDFFSGEPSAKEVVVNWELAPGTSSIEWTSGAGTCTGTKTAVSGSCKVTMNEAHALVAKLE